MKSFWPFPKVEKSTSAQISKAAAETISEWNLTDDIVGMSFNTTAANTGHLSGACVLLEQLLGKDYYGWPADTISLKLSVVIYSKRYFADIRATCNVILQISGILVKNRP